MAQQPPIGPVAPAVTSEAQRVSVTLDLEAIYQRLHDETIRQITDLSQQGLSGDELAAAVESALGDLSDAPIDQMGRGAASESFNLGRNLAVQAQPAAFSVAVRTEILDENTCDPCRALDGREFAINSPEYFEFMPPNECDGRELCRGFYLMRAA